MITAVLAMAFTWCLLLGRMPRPLLIILCAGLGVFFTFFNRHKHTQALPIDVMAQRSRLKNINPALKFWTLLALLLICVASRRVYSGIFLAIAMPIIAVFASGLSLRRYVHVMSLPVLFLLAGGFALLFGISDEPAGILSFSIFGFWLCVTAKAQAQTMLVIARALGAVSCLCLLSTSTPMPDIIGVLRRARCPGIVIDLMYLIYRYIFILLSLHHEMRDAAKSRLGFRDYRTSLRAAGRIYSNLLARSYQFANKNFDAMESRCYDTGIRFLEHKKKASFAQISISAALLITAAALSL